MKSNLGEIVSPGICGQKELSCLPCGEELRRSSDTHPIEGAPFLQQEDLSGVRGRTRERKTYRNLVPNRMGGHLNNINMPLCQSRSKAILLIFHASSDDTLYQQTYLELHEIH